MQKNALAAHVFNVYGIAREGNSAFKDQINANGPKTIARTTKTIIIATVNSFIRLEKCLVSLYEDFVEVQV